MKTTALILCVTQLCIVAACGFSNDGSSLVRSLDKTSTLTNTPVVVTATFTNGGTDVLRGFYYTDHVPSGLTVTTLSVTLNAQTVTNYSFESGQDGDVYAGYTPVRWVLERPTGFAETNAVPPQGIVQVVYSVSSPALGSFNLQQFTWAGLNPATTNAVFGHSELSDQRTITFVHPTATRLEVDRKIRDFKAGIATQQDVSDVVKIYMQNDPDPTR